MLNDAEKLHMERAWQILKFRMQCLTIRNRALGMPLIQRKPAYEARIKWEAIVRKYYGPNVTIKYILWNEENMPTCHIEGDIYI